jgi:pectin lyase
MATWQLEAVPQGVQPVPVALPSVSVNSATGGGNATPVYPTSTDELVSYLGDDEARVIVLSILVDGNLAVGGSTPRSATGAGGAALGVGEVETSIVGGRLTMAEC